MAKDHIQKNFRIPVEMANRLEKDLKRLGRMVGRRIQYMEVAEMAIELWLELPDRDKLTRLAKLRMGAALDILRSTDEQKTDDT